MRSRTHTHTQVWPDYYITFHVPEQHDDSPTMKIKHTSVMHWI